MTAKWLLALMAAVFLTSIACLGAEQGNSSCAVCDTARFANGVVSLAFDDGHVSIYDSVWPALDDMGWGATLFIITSKLDAEDDYYMTWDQVAELADAGFDVESHSDTHRHLIPMGNVDLFAEIRAAKENIKAINPNANIIAVPYGETNSNVDRAIGQYFAFERTSVHGFNNLGALDSHNIKVQVVVNTTTDDEVRAWVAQAAQNKGWLVILYHLVETQGEEYSISPQTFDSHLKIIEGSGLPVATMQEVLKTAKFA